MTLLAGALLLGAGAGLAPAFCFEEAAARYGVPSVLLHTIAQAESGLDPEASGWNADGSVDVGLMQINSWWETRLGYREWVGVCTDPCYNVMVGAWILRDCLDRHGYTVAGIGCYNARSPEKRERYAKKILSSVLEQLGTRGGPE
ncbi:MAG: lytic transglycosylase domain-containing protein [Proteobacteria bacterium]|nr:lytic transglycosylase domain-containing protein [Pseudomonadota bacterium]